MFANKKPNRNALGFSRLARATKSGYFSPLMPAGTKPPTFDCLSAMRALSELTRVRLVRQLIDGPKTVTELCEALGATPYNVSKHLRILREAGLLEVTRQSQLRIYSLAAKFRQKLSSNATTLDLGCCKFHFDQLPE